VAAFFAYIATIIEMWDILKPIIDTLKSTPLEDRERVGVVTLKASKLASSVGDTSEYENLVKKGRLN